MPRLEHGQARGDVLARDLQRLGHRAHAVVDANVRVPQRVPQQLGDLADDVVGHVVVQQHQVEVRVRQQLPASQATGGDDREAAGGGDADLGGLCGEPEIVQVQQRVAQRGRIQLTRTTGEQLFGCGRQIGRGDEPSPPPGLP